MSTLIKKILNELSEIELRYKGGARANLADLFRVISGNKNTLKSSISRLCNKGYIQKDGEGWVITKSGKDFLTKGDLEKFKSPFKKGAKRDLLVMFDIPEDCRQYRDWLRDQLKLFGYIMVQQSVWIGPSPLPTEFKKYLKKLKLQKSIRSFKLAKELKVNLS